MTINEIILELKKNWHMYKIEKNPNILQKTFNKVFPLDYFLFLKELGEGSYEFNDFIFSSWCSETIIENNKNYKINDYLGDNLIGIATDGGGICFLLDFREAGQTKLSCVSLGDLDINEVIVLADSFTIGLQLMLEQKITLDTLMG